MNIVEATILIQGSAKSNQRTFVDQLIHVSENIGSYSDEMYDAFVLFQNTVSGYFSYGAKKAHLQQIARDFDNLDQVAKDRIYNKLPIENREHIGVVHTNFGVES